MRSFPPPPSQGFRTHTEFPSTMTAAATTSTRTKDAGLGWDVWRVAIAMILGAFMSVIDMTIVNVALAPTCTPRASTRCSGS
jgi:hypothetical protein